MDDWLDEIEERFDHGDWLPYEVQDRLISEVRRLREDKKWLAKFLEPIRKHRTDFPKYSFTLHSDNMALIGICEAMRKYHDLLNEYEAETGGGNG